MVGKVVRASNWPGVHGARFLVKELGQSPVWGEFAWCREFDGSTPFQWRAIPTKFLAVDAKATRKYEALVARKEEQ